MASYPLVGRSEAVAEVEAVLAAGRAGRGSLVLVTGEAGVGKSRLVQEVVSRAAGYRTAWHGCEPAAAAFRPWVRLLRTVVPGRADVFPDGGPPTEGMRERMFDDVVDLLATSAADTPLLMVLDDVHDADASSLELLGHVARQLRATRVVIIATCRDGEAAWQGRGRIRGELVRAGRSVPLATLSTDDVARLMAASGSSPRPDTLRVVAQRTGGSPLLVTELVTFLRSRGGLGDPITALAVPESVRHWWRGDSRACPIPALRPWPWRQHSAGRSRSARSPP